MHIFSNRLEYIISQELPFSIKIQETSNCQIIVVIIMRNISLGMSPTFSKSQNPSIGQSRVFANVLQSFLWMDNILEIFLLIVLLYGRFSHGAPLVMVTIYVDLPLLVSLLSSTLLKGNVLFVKKCYMYQRHADLHYTPTELLHSMTSP